MSKRSKATDISIKTRQLVYERDNGLCIICGRPGIPNSHYIRRSKGGLGIPQNIVTMCISCHNAYDNGNRREEIATKTRTTQIRAATNVIRRICAVLKCFFGRFRRGVIGTPSSGSSTSSFG